MRMAGVSFCNAASKVSMAAGLGRINNGLGQQPCAVGAVGANFERVGGNHLDARDGGGLQVRQDGGRFRAVRPQEMFKRKNEREQRRGDDQPDQGVFRVHYFLRRSQTNPPSTSTPPGNAPSNSQRTWLLLLSRHHQPEFHDGTRANALQQGGTVQQPIDGVTGEIAVRAAVNIVDCRETTNRPPPPCGRPPWAVANAFHLVLFDGDHQRISCGAAGRVRS